ncbi:U32 family peptidase [Aquifex aeolicus]|uniref:Collagenase n=1 Tax=Aquifex aeolicus (strain VF5) TaxID=224324 RepID=O67129_AQUAE|nr:U32 family peptidase [Aquifex aeolicus]AAC07088.1 collagenase [Aquifex aeolicus VF5]
MRKPEILAPAGNWEGLSAALKAGAEAVYFGLDKLNQRSLKKNFSMDELGEIKEFCAEHGARAYLTLNSIVFDEDIPYVEEVLHRVKESGIDAVIAWDFAVMTKSLEMGIETHASVMTGIANSVSAKFFENLGIKRIVPAKELNLEQLKRLKRNTNLEIEAFVHGAMCMAISGRCFLSHEVFKKSGNRGECYQVCRHEFQVVIRDLNPNAKGAEYVLGEDYVLSARDLMTLDIIEHLMFLDAWKIEGRSKNPDYVYMVTKAYRTARDALLEGSFNEKLRQELIDMVSRVYHREWDSGFYFGKASFGVNESVAKEKKVYVGKVQKFYPRISVAEVKLEAGDLRLGDTIHIIGKKTGVVRQKVESMQIDGKPVEVAQKGSVIGLKTVDKVREGDKVYLIVEVEKEEELTARA